MKPEIKPSTEAICEAYETGRTRGFNGEDLAWGKAFYATPEEGEAYVYGYEAGLEAQKKSQTLPDCWRLVEQDYQRIFNAIAAATNTDSGRGINVSVRAFWEYLDKNQPEPPKG